MPTFDNSYQVILEGLNQAKSPAVENRVYQSVPVPCTVTKGGPIPDWRLKIAMGEDCTTVLDGRRARVRVPYISKTETHKTDGRYWMSSGSNHSASFRLLEGANTPLSTNLDLTAYGRASANWLGSYRKQTRHLQGLVTAGEIGQTLRGIIRPLKSFRQGLSNLLRRYRKDVKRASKTYSQSRNSKDHARILLDMLSSTWLEWRFGMIPTMADADGMARVLADLSETPDRAPSLRVKGTGDSRFTESSKQQLSHAGGWSSPYVEYQLRREHLISCRLLSGIRADCESYPTIMTALGATMGDFFPALYELIPFSFLEGYFGNAQEVIDVWANRRIKTTWTCRNNLRSRITSVSGPTRVDQNPNSYTRVDSFNQKVYRREVFRIPVDPGSFLHIPSYHFAIPGLGLKWINMGALAAQYGRLLNDVRFSLRV